jgi:hypothetical protein
MIVSPFANGGQGDNAKGLGMIGNSKRPQTDEAADKLLVDRRTAARMLSISERTLFDWINAGIVPCLKIRGRVLFSVDALRARIAELQRGDQQAGSATT